MRIAYVTSQYPPDGVGGIGTFVQALARVMAARGHDVVVISSAVGHTRSTQRVGGVTVERFPPAGPGWLWRTLAALPLPSSRVHSAVSAWRALRRLDAFDVVEAPEWRAEGLLLRWARRGALVVHLHVAHEVERRWVSPGRSAGRAAVADWLERRSVRRADAVTAVTRLTTTLPGGRQWLPGQLVTLVPPPAEAGDWADCEPVAGSDPVVLFLGHRERRKAPEVVIEAAARLMVDLPDIVVVFAGRTSRHDDGRSYDELLAEQATRLGVRIELHEPAIGHAEMRSLYGRARVVVVPSRFETLSMVALEGLLSARPTIVTGAVGASELIGPELPQLVVPVDDPEALAEAARPYLADPALAEQVGCRGQAIVRSLCDADRIVRAREVIYEQVAEARRAG